MCHLRCLTPPQSAPPRGRWYCRFCKARKLTAGFRLLRKRCAVSSAFGPSSRTGLCSSATETLAAWLTCMLASRTQLQPDLLGWHVCRTGDATSRNAMIVKLSLLPMANRGVQLCQVRSRQGVAARGLAGGR